MTCAVCGKEDAMRHHIQSRGAGGSDAPQNLVNLCFECHRKVHDGKLKLDTVILQPSMGIEAMIDMLLNIRDSEWDVAKFCYFLTVRGVSINQLSFLLKKSKRHINELINTFRVFYKEEQRIPELSFTHHKIAARASNPYEALLFAYENKLSTREFSWYVDSGDVWKYRCDRVIAEIKKLLRSPYGDYLKNEIQKQLTAARSS